MTGSVMCMKIIIAWIQLYVLKTRIQYKQIIEFVVQYDHSVGTGSEAHHRV